MNESRPAAARGDAAAMAPEPTSRPRKRQKISLACEECRSRKVRCDGIRPRCTACSRKRRERPCQYPSEPAKVSSDRRFMQSLQERLAQLEGRLAHESSPSGGHERRRDSMTSSESTRASMQQMPQVTYAAAVGADNSASPLLEQDESPPTQDRRHSGHVELTEQHYARTAMPPPPPSPPADLHDDPKEAPSICPDEDAGSINAMGVARLTPEDTSSATATGEFYGKSSATAFFSDIQGRLHRTNANSNGADTASYGTSTRTGLTPQGLAPGPPPHPPRRRPSTMGCSNPQPAFSDRSLVQMDDYHLPPRHMADQFLDLYWRRVHCLYPYLHWPTLTRAYQRLWMSDAEIKASPRLTGVGLGGPECSATIFYCALNAIFALGAQFSARSPRERKEIAKPFARRARYLLRIDCLDHGDLALVQALLIMAHYLQSTNLPTRCWNVAGVAYRMAQGLGLHVEVPDGDRGLPSLNKEMRKRVWYGCVCLDIVLGMAYGRPCLSSRKSSVTLPGLLDEEVSTPRSTDSQDYATAASTTAFFVETIKLYKILDRILGTIYDPWKESEAANRDQEGSEERAKEFSQQIAIILELDGDLDRFEEEMAECMHWSCQPPELGQDDVLRRQRNVIRTRYLHTRILLYRPVFAQLCVQSSQANSGDRPQERTPRRKEDQLLGSLVERCSITCVETSQVLIDHINSTSRSADTGAPWFNAYYVYHSAMVLTLAEFCPSIRRQLDHDRLSRAWQQCRDFLQRMIEHDAESYRYLRTLKDISQLINVEPAGEGEAAAVGPAISNEQQGLIVNHITNPCLDPSMASWLEDSSTTRFDLYAQPAGDEFDMGLLRDQPWMLSTSNPFLALETEWNEDLGHLGG